MMNEIDAGASEAETPDYDDEDYVRKIWSHHPEDLREDMIRQWRKRREQDEAAKRWRQAQERRNAPLSPLSSRACVRLTIRLPYRLHAEASRVVADSGISLNTFLVTAVARAVGQEYEPLE